MQEQIAAGIVLYNPDEKRFRKNLNAIEPQVQRIFLADNGSQNIAEIERILREYPKCQLIRNEKNLGIAAALNQIFRQAESEGFQWVLTLDDDSVCDCDMVQKMIPYMEWPDIGIICPTAVDDKMDHEKGKEPEQYSYVDDCITAGSLTSVQAWEKAGCFDEKMFIDFVDIEFCKRLRLAEYQICRVNQTSVHQEYGNIDGSFSVFGKKFYKFQYSPLRIYYSVRNQIYYMKKHRKNLNIMAQLMFLTGYIGKRIFFEGRRKESIKAICRGICDGIKMEV